MSCTLKTSAFVAEPNIWGANEGAMMEAADQRIAQWPTQDFQRFVGFDSTDDDGMIHNHLHDCASDCYGDGEMFSDTFGELKYAARTETGLGQQPPGVCFTNAPCEWEYPNGVSLNFGGIQACPEDDSVPPDQYTACFLAYLQSKTFMLPLAPPQGSSCLYFQSAAVECPNETGGVSMDFSVSGFSTGYIQFKISASFGTLHGHNGPLFSYINIFSQCPPPTFLEGIFPNQLPQCTGGSSPRGTGGVVLTNWL